MRESLERIYKRTKDGTLLDAAVKKGWITEADKDEIMEAG